MGLFGKMKKKLVLAFVAVVFAFGCLVPSVTAVAEDVGTSSEYSEGVVTESDESTESADNLNGNMTWEEFLNEMQDKADEYGQGDKWSETIDDIKNAVSEKKFDGLFFASIGQLLLLCAYFIYKVCSNVSLKLMIAKVDTLLKKVGELTSATNSLIDETKCVEEEEKTILASYEAQKKASEYVNEALKNMVDGIKFTPEKKAASLRALNKANECLDEIQRRDENDSKTQ